MRAIWLLLILAFSSAPCCATVIHLGTNFFDILPGSDTSPGVNSFVISNLTGDPVLGGFAVPDAFPVVDFLTFPNSKLILAGDIFTTIELGDLDPGFHSNGRLEFSETVQFTSAKFTAELDKIAFVLHDRITFRSVSRDLTVTLGRTSGSHLVAGVDVTAILGSDVPIPSPQPVLRVSPAAIFVGVRQYLIQSNPPNRPR